MRFCCFGLICFTTQVTPVLHGCGTNSRFAIFLTQTSRDKVNILITQIHRSRDDTFANGRQMRSLFESVYENLARRVEGTGSEHLQGTLPTGNWISSEEEAGTPVSLGGTPTTKELPDKNLIENSILPMHKRHSFLKSFPTTHQKLAHAYPRG